MNSRDFVLLTLQLTTMLAASIVFGQVARRFRQPAVLGEMLGGILLGVTVFGAVAPDQYDWLFLSSANATVVRDASIKLGMLFFLFVAGSEIDLSELRQLGRRAGAIGIVGTVIPILVGIAVVYALPRDFWGEAVRPHYFEFAVFVGMNLANSANPVLARILLDLGLLRTPVGTLSMTATIFDDLINWTLFAVILNNVAPSASISAISDNLAVNVGLVLLLFVTILGGGRWLRPRLVRFLHAHLAWPSGFIAATAVVILLAASLSEGLGMHAFLGAFLAGAALGGHHAEHADDEQPREVIARFALSFFAPIYFVSMGMSTDFVAEFDLGLVTLIIAVGLVSKLGAVLLGARLAGMPIDRETWAVAWGLNARGATGIILASVGRATGVIDDRIFVAVVVLALVTSLLAAPVMTRLLADRTPTKPA